MFTLYHRFIQQIKQEQIQRYNQKHKDYLYRCGKLKQQSTNRNLGNNFKKTQTLKINNKDQNVTQTTKTSSQFIAKEIEIPLKNQNRQKIAETFSNQPKKDQLERNNQMRPQEITFKQKNTQPLIIQKFNQPVNQLKQKVNFGQLQEVQEVELIQCPEDCGRKFNPKALDKHIKICQKGEVKRKVFKVKVVDQQAQNLKKDEPAESQKKSKIPKWKKESNQIRNMVKKMQSLNQGNQQNGQLPKLTQPEQEDDRKMCPGCGRKFNQKAAEKHIPNCVKRNKEKK